jgi:hypothetical protein
MSSAMFIYKYALGDFFELRYGYNFSHKEGFRKTLAKNIKVTFSIPSFVNHFHVVFLLTENSLVTTLQS